MSEYFRRTSEEQYDASQIEYFESRLLRAAFHQCVQSPEYDRYADVRREHTIETNTGVRRRLVFESAYTDDARAREYVISVYDSDVVLFSELLDVQRDNVLEGVKGMIIKQTFDADLNEVNTEDVEEALHDDSWWQYIHDPDMCGDIELELVAGWRFSFTEGSAIKQFMTVCYFDNELLDESIAGELDVDEYLANDVDQATRSTLIDMTEDILHVSRDDLELVKGALMQLGLTTAKSLHKYNKGL